MGFLAVFWGPALISLLVCFYPSLMSPLLPLWFPPPLKNLSSSLCLRTVNPHINSHEGFWETFKEPHLLLHPCYIGPSSVCPNRSTDDAISQVPHSSLTHIDSKNGNYVRLLFIDFSSTFNTIVPIKLAVKLTDLGLNSSLKDSKFPHRQTSSGKNGPVHLQLHHPEHRSPTGLCPESPALLSLHTRLRVLSQLHFYC